jgi:hypothetical protein
VSVLADPTPDLPARSRITKLVILSSPTLSRPNRIRCPIWTSPAKCLKSVNYTDLDALDIVSV